MHMNNYCLKIIVCVRCSKKFARFLFFYIILQEVSQSELKECMRFNRL